jgi:hypothetical protein
VEGELLGSQSRGANPPNSYFDVLGFGFGYMVTLVCFASFQLDEDNGSRSTEQCLQFGLIEMRIGCFS